MAAMHFLDVRGGRDSPPLCGSKEEILIIPITGEGIREGPRSGVSLAGLVSPR